VIFALLRPQAVKAEIDDESFAEGLDADTVDAASRAFWEELIDFFQKLGRDDQATIVRTQQKFLIQVVKKVTGKLGAIDLDQLLANRRSESIPGESFGGSLESAD
jgi:hypothetical protein